jgi:glycosyltransferase involved in cell wall biosynthesis
MKRRVLIMHHYGGWGGAGIMLYNLIERLYLENLEIHLLLPFGILSERIAARYPDIIVHHMLSIREFPHYEGMDSNLTNFWNLRKFFNFFSADHMSQRVLMQVDPNVIILNSSVLVTYLKNFRAIASDAIIILLIQENISNGVFGFRKAYVTKLVKKYSDLIVFISSYDLKKFGKTNKWMIVRNWIAQEVTEKYKNEIFEEDAGVLFLGGGSKLKGAHTIIEAFRVLRSSGQNVKLTILGDLPQTARNPFVKFYINKVNRSLSKLSNVQILGNVAEPYEYINRCLLLAFPITKPHQGRPIMEAGFFSKPVVASRFEALFEDLEDKKSGLYFKPSHPKELARVIQKLTSDYAMRRAMGIENNLIYNDLHSRNNADQLVSYILYGEKNYDR